MKKYIAFFEVILYNNSIQLWPTLLWKCLYLQKWKFLLQASSTPPTSSTSSPTYTTPSTGYPSVQGDQRNIGNIGNIKDCHHSKNGKFQFYYTGCPLPKICECGFWSTNTPCHLPDTNLEYPNVILKWHDWISCGGVSCHLAGSLNLFLKPIHKILPFII